MTPPPVQGPPISRHCFHLPFDTSESILGESEAEEPWHTG